MRNLRSALAVVGAAVILVLAANTVSLAATGQALLLGKSNSANTYTSITRTTSGTVLSLKSTSSSSSPLSVNGRGKVANLNVDELDGYSSGQLQTNSYLWTKAVSVSANNLDVTLPVPPGSYIVGYSLYAPNSGTDGAIAYCYFYRDRNGDNNYYAETRVLTKTGASSALSATGHLTVASGDELHLYCFTPVAFTTISNEPMQIYATKVHSLGGGALRISTARRAH